MSNNRYIAKKYPDINDVNPEVIRKAKRLLEVYGEIHKPLIISATIRILISGLFERNGWVTFDKSIYSFITRQCLYENRNIIIDSILCTAISGLTYETGKLIYQYKHYKQANWNQISACNNNGNHEIIWNSPYCEEIYDNSYQNSAKVFSDLPERRRCNGENIVGHDINQLILYPIYINDDEGNLKYVVKRSSAVVNGSSRMFPFLSKYNKYIYRWKGIKYLYANVEY